MTLDMRREIAYDVGATTHGHNSIAFSPPRVSVRCGRTYRSILPKAGFARLEER